jgi:WD40 repeat protein
MANRVFSFFAPKEDKTVNDVEIIKKPLQLSIPPARVEHIIKSAHEDDITCLAISRDESLLATGGNDRKVVLYQNGILIINYMVV